MVSVVAVANHAGVSPATVSRVLGGRVRVSAETRARVLQAIEALGYRPNEVARSLRAGRGRAVALVTGDIEQGINAALAKNVQSELEALGLDLLLFNMEHREERLRHFLERSPSLGLRGVLLTSPHVMDMPKLLPMIEVARKGGVAVVSIGQDFTAHGIPSVVHDNAGGAAMAVAHLLAHGRAPIAFVGRIATSAIGGARFAGYRAGLQAHGETIDPALVWDISEGYRADAGYQATAVALKRNVPFRAVLAASDELALGGMAAAVDRGLAVPQDIAFVGFGGLGWGTFARPSLSTVTLDAEAAARAVSDFLKADTTPGATAGLKTIPTTLVLRQSA
jgi:DNA-binding LacI/PurR family transcriptional regulator